MFLRADIAGTEGVHLRELAALIAIFALSVGPAGGQEESAGLIRGYVAGSGADDALGGAVVYVRDSPHTTIANSSGYFELRVPAGLWVVSVFHQRGQALAEGAPSLLVAVAAGDTTDADFLFTEAEPGGRASPYVLQGVEVLAERTRTAARRREGVRLDVLDLDEIQELETSARHVGDLVRSGFPTLDISEPNASTLCIESRRAGTVNRRRGGSCPHMVAVLLDGVLVNEPGSYLAGLPPSSIARIEYLPALFAGARYGTNAGNGVLLLWTR